jgi:RNA polymerase sigma factor (TIGR02999 family)
MAASTSRLDSEHRDDASEAPSPGNESEPTSSENAAPKSESEDDTGFDTPLPDVDVTRLLRRARDGSDTAREELFRLTYDELRSMAERELRKRHSGGTLSVTSVVNRAYLRMVDDEDGRINTYANRLHFFGTAARAMRSAIIDYARYKTRQKRGGDQADVALEDVLSPEADGQPLETLLTVESALQQLEAVDPDLARVVELIFFGGMLQREVAELEGVDVRTVQRRWRKAKLILRDVLSSEEDSDI